MPIDFEAAKERYDRRTRVAYEVMGLRWQRFQAAKDAFLAEAPGTPRWHVLAERVYRLGIRSTHAYYLWTEGHTAVFAPTSAGKPVVVQERKRAAAAE